MNHHEIIIQDDEFEDDEKTNVIPKQTPLEITMKSIQEQLRFPPIIFCQNPEYPIDLDQHPIFDPIIKN